MISHPCNSPFRVLSLDGGGIRGAFSATVLAEMETHLEHPLHSYFDLIAGTSTGAIIAVALAFGIPAARVRDLYVEKGPLIFSPRKKAKEMRFWGPLLDALFTKYKVPATADGLVQSRYTADALLAALSEILGDEVLENAKTRLLVPSVDLSTGKTVTFKTPHQPGFIRDRYIRAVDVIMATTAAPTYFPHCVIREGSAYVDGGLWANNPSIAAYVEAQKLRKVCTRPEVDPIYEVDDICLLSIGTGSPGYSLVPPSHGAGVAWWGRNLMQVASVSAAQGTHYQTELLLGDRYRRVDFSMVDQGWGLDAIERIPHLLHHGREQAVARFAELRPLFFFGPTSPYGPFPARDVAPTPADSF